MEKDDKTIITLCGSCYQNYSIVPNRKLILKKRNSPDTCMHCQVRNGWDYLVVETKKTKK